MIDSFSPDKPKKTALSLNPWMIWGCAGLFYFYEMILRASPSVMVDDLMRDLGVTSTGLGVLSSFYYYSYVILQIPCGMIVDRFGTRRVVTFSTLLCVVGSFCFAYSQALPLAQLGRFLIGAGSACAFISCLKITADWFSPARFALIAGLTNMMGTIGGMCSGPPFALLVNNFGWRHATIIASFIGLGIALICWVMIPEKQRECVPPLEAPKNQSLLTDIKGIINQPVLWGYAIFGGLMYIPISAFCELWCVPFLMKKYSITNDVASFANVMVYLGIALGSPLVVKISDALKSRYKIMSFSSIATTGMFLGILYLPDLSLPMMFGFLFVAGIFNSGQILSFACVKESLPNQMSGTAVGFTNSVVMMSGFIFQPLLGKLLDLFWDGTLSKEGIPLYTSESYQMAILAVPICLFFSWILLRMTYRSIKSS